MFMCGSTSSMNLTFLLFSLVLVDILMPLLIVHTNTHFLPLIFLIMY